MIISLTVQSLGGKNLATARTQGFDSDRMDSLMANPDADLNGNSLFVYYRPDSSISENYTVTETVSAIATLTAGGTATGTTNETFGIDTDAVTFVKIKNNAGVLEVRNQTDAAYANFTAAAITCTAITSVLTAAQTIDITAYDHTAAEVFAIDFSASSASCNIIDVDAGVAVALSAAEVLTGVDVTSVGIAANADTSAIVGFYATVSEVSTGRADCTGVLVDVASARDTADTDQGVLIGFSGTMNNASAVTYGVRMTTQSFTHTAGNFYGYYLMMSNEITANTAIAGYWLLDSAEYDNPKHGLVISKDLTNSTAVGALSNSNEALSIQSVNASSGTASGASTIANNLVYIDRQDSAAVAIADVYRGNVAVITYSATTTGAGTASCSASALTIDYNVAETAGTLTMATSDVAYIDYDTTGTPTFGAGTYNLLHINGSNNAASPAYTATTVVRGLKVNLSNMVVSDTDLDLFGISVVSPIGSTASRTLEVVATTDVATATLILGSEISLTPGTTSAVNMLEALRVTLDTDTGVGNWGNAICGKIDLNDNGVVTGMGGVICAELDVATNGLGGVGTYACFEAEIGMDGTSGGAPISAMIVNVWGAQATDFDANGYILDVTGLTSGAASVYYDHDGTAGGDQVNGWLRIRVNGAAYWIGLYDATH